MSLEISMNHVKMF